MEIDDWTTTLILDLTKQEYDDMFDWLLEKGMKYSDLTSLAKRLLLDEVHK